MYISQFNTAGSAFVFPAKVGFEFSIAAVNNLIRSNTVGAGLNPHSHE